MITFLPGRAGLKRFSEERHIRRSWNTSKKAKCHHDKFPIQGRIGVVMFMLNMMYFTILISWSVDAWVKGTVPSVQSRVTNNSGTDHRLLWTHLYIILINLAEYSSKNEHQSLLSHSQISLVNIVSKCSRASGVTSREQLIEMVTSP